MAEIDIVTVNEWMATIERLTRERDEAIEAAKEHAKHSYPPGQVETYLRERDEARATINAWIEQAMEVPGTVMAAKSFNGNPIEYLAGILAKRDKDHKLAIIAACECGTEDGCEGWMCSGECNMGLSPEALAWSHSSAPLDNHASDCGDKGCGRFVRVVRGEESKHG